uniref:Ral GTPase-activating protein subunit alpha/beta N-terminal domain-containing protein n=1 Tax=Bos mutus grunniens TaxID=30521 RepID=A0A8C0A6W4_BOSMU
MGQVETEGCDNVDASDLKQFFETNYSQIYFIFYENFITLENSLKLKGIRLFLLWLQALQTNCAEEQVLIFASLVPGFPAIMSSRGPCTLDTLINPGPNMADAKIHPEEITPLLPAVSGEKIAEDQTCFFLQVLLKYMVTQAASLEWKHKENQETGFKFLFTLFRKYYLPHLFPSFTKSTNIYKPVLDIPHLRPKPVYVTTTRDNESIYSTKIPYMAARVVFIKWMVTFFLEKKYLTATQNTKNGVDVLPKIIQVCTAVPERVPEPDAGGAAEQDRGLTDGSTLCERRLSGCSLCGIEEEHRAVYDMVQRILLSTRGYVNFVNEVFRQAFLLPSCDIAVTRKVVQVYRKWILQDKPVFMEEPDIKEAAQEDAEKLGYSETDNKQTSSEGSGHKRSSSWGRSYSFTSAMSRGCVMEEENKNVKAGAQAMLQVFLTNAANVFLLEPCVEVPMLLKEQVDACKAVLIIFRRMIMELTMNKTTWEQMLQILLRITEAVMQKPKDKQIKDLFAQSLAGLLFRTLIVAWIRANLCVYVSRELWDDFLGVLSSLTDWEELIHEWASIMDSLTAVLARTVYGVEMTNLPLDKLSEQKEKKQRGKGCVPDSQKGSTVGRSFSLSWRSHPDMAVAEPMRFRSATTSGRQGSRKPETLSARRQPVKVEEYLQPENTPVTEPLCPEPPPGQKLENAQNVSSSEPRLAQESKGHEKKEHEGITILVRRSSSPIELDLKDDSQQMQGKCRERQKSDSVSSDPTLGCSTEAELSLSHWQTCEEDPDLSPPADTVTDADARHWLQLRPTDASNLTDSSECLADDCSIIAGGTLTGWHPDSAAVLWRRILGILGDVNNIQSPKIHARVFGYLYELWYKLAKIRDNLAISLDNQSSPSPPALIPPLRMFASWRRRCLTIIRKANCKPIS